MSRSLRGVPGTKERHYGDATTGAARCRVAAANAPGAGMLPEAAAGGTRVQ